MLERIVQRATPWDMVIIGGGATGVGVAIDAASRGFDVLLLESHDFGKATSSRSTKLVHGGVRYLEQGNLALVMDALKERGLLRKNAPHLVHQLAFIVPSYSWWEMPFYGIGMQMYDLLARKYGFSRSRLLSVEETLEKLPNLERKGLRGGVVYYDGQFDDARLLMHMVATAADHGATLLNYAAVYAVVTEEDGVVSGVRMREVESGKEFLISARVVINATGIFADRIRRMADAGAGNMVVHSQGIHLVFERSFLSGDAAIMVPHTSDGRVLFAIPWHGHTLLGTTDTPIADSLYDPLPLEKEIDFILETAAKYLSRPPARKDVLSVFVGIRPLIKTPHKPLNQSAARSGIKTSSLSRDHTIQIDPCGLLTIAGGKWTTYRHMAEDCVNHAIPLGKLRAAECVTRSLKLHGYRENTAESDSLGVYGSDANDVRALAKENASLLQPLHPELPYCAAEVLWAVRSEMARTLDDVLSRRTRALFLNARAAMEMSATVARLMAPELHYDDAWVQDQVTSFKALAETYLVPTRRTTEGVIT